MNRKCALVMIEFDFWMDSRAGGLTGGWTDRQCTDRQVHRGWTRCSDVQNAECVCVSKSASSEGSVDSRHRQPTAGWKLDISRLQVEAVLRSIHTNVVDGFYD